MPHSRALLRASGHPFKIRPAAEMGGPLTDLSTTEVLLLSIKSKHQQRNKIINAEAANRRSGEA